MNEAFKLTKVQGNDGVTSSRCELCKLLGLLLQLGEGCLSARLFGCACCSSSSDRGGEEATHVPWLEERLGLLQREDDRLLLHVAQHIVDADDALRLRVAAVVDDGALSLQPHEAATLGQHAVVAADRLALTAHCGRER